MKIQNAPKSRPSSNLRPDFFGQSKPVTRPGPASRPPVPTKPPSLVGTATDCFEPANVRRIIRDLEAQGGPSKGSLGSKKDVAEWARKHANDPHDLTNEAALRESWKRRAEAK